MKRSISMMSLPLLAGCLIASSAMGYDGDCLFMIAWDGVRYDQLDSYTAPHLLGAIKEEGIWLPHLYNAWHTWTSPGHANFHTGNVNLHPNTSEFWMLSHYYPSLMETYLKEHNLSGDDTTWAWVFGNSSNDADWGRSHHAGYNGTFVASRKFAYLEPDTYLWDEVLLPTLESYHPPLFWVDFHEVDYRGHRIKTPEDSLEYREAIRRVDSLTAIIFEYIDTSLVYSGRTNVFITTDHGRHSEGILTGLKDHGCDCNGCRRVFGCLWGPDFKDNVVDYTNYYQTDIAYEFSHILGLRAPHTRNRTLVSGWLDNYVPEDPWPYDPSGGSRISVEDQPCASPDISCSDYGQVHTVWCENQRKIVWRTKYPSWYDPITLTVASDDELLREPRVSCLGTTVTITWQRYRPNNHGFYSWYLEGITSTNGGMVWSTLLTEGFEDAAIMTADVVVGEDGISTYSLVAGTYTAFEGSRDSVGVVSIRKFYDYDPQAWWESGRYPDNNTYQADYVTLERFGSVCVAVCQVYDRVDQNSEIIATWSNVDGNNWRKNWTPITKDTGGSPYIHQRYPSPLVIFK